MKLCIVILAIFLFYDIANTQPMWGVRNITKIKSHQLINELTPSYQAWGLNWKRLEKSDNEFNFTTVKKAFVFMDSTYDCIPIFKVSTYDCWATPGSKAGSEMAPFDLDRLTSLSEMPLLGYSESIYRMAFQLTKYIDERYSGEVYLRFVVEPGMNWLIDPENPDESIEDYIRCLRTFYKACHDYADTTDLNVHVSHGGFHNVTNSLKSWFDVGEDNPEKQDSLLTLFNSYSERMSPEYFISWATVKAFMEMKEVELKWTNALLENSESVDFHDFHTHYKPWLVHSEVSSIQSELQELGLSDMPLLSAESAMYMEMVSARKFDEDFHANDMAKKWILAAAFDVKAMCTPIVGAPADYFFGYYSADSNSYKAKDVSVYLQQIFNDISSNIRNLSDVTKYHFRWEDEGFDIVWKKSLSDLDDSKIDFNLLNYEYKKVTNVLNQEIDIHGTPVYELGQDPIIINWNSTSILSEMDNVILIFPNPSSEFIEIKGFCENKNFFSSDMNLCVYNSIGQTVLTQSIPRDQAASLKIDTSELPSGVYTIVIQDNKESIIKNFVVL